MGEFAGEFAPCFAANRTTAGTLSRAPALLVTPRRTKAELKSRSAAAVSSPTEVCYPFGRKHGRHWAVQRREFITLLGGAAAAWPLTARAQQPGRMRRIGVLTGFGKDDPESQRRVTAFLRGLQELGWWDGRNVRVDFRWGTGDYNRIRTYAKELVSLNPDAILVNSSSVLLPLRKETLKIPIVFVQ